MGAVETTINQIEDEIRKAKNRNDDERVEELERKLQAAKSYH